MLITLQQIDSIETASGDSGVFEVEGTLMGEFREMRRERIDAIGD